MSSSSTSETSSQGTPIPSENTSVDISQEAMDSKQLEQPLIKRFGEIYAENAVAKITRTAVDALINNVSQTRAIFINDF